VNADGVPVGIPRVIAATSETISLAKPGGSGGKTLRWRSPDDADLYAEVAVSGFVDVAIEGRFADTCRSILASSRSLGSAPSGTSSGGGSRRWASQYLASETCSRIESTSSLGTSRPRL